MPDNQVPRIGFLGAGKMATALARGWLKAGLTRPDRVMASDPLPEALAPIRHGVFGMTRINRRSPPNPVANCCSEMPAAIDTIRCRLVTRGRISVSKLAMD